MCHRVGDDGDARCKRDDKVTEKRMNVRCKVKHLLEMRQRVRLVCSYCEQRKLMGYSLGTIISCGVGILNEEVDSRHHKVFHSSRNNDLELPRPLFPPTHK